MTDSLRINNDIVLLSSFSTFNDTVNDSLLISVIPLRKKNFLGSVGHTAPKRNISGASAHYFNNGATFMRSGSIPNLINRLHGGINGSIKADSIVCAGDIQVNCSGHADSINPKRGKLSGPHKGTVSSNNHHTVNAVLFTDFRTLLLSFGSSELFTTGSIENGASATDNIRYGMAVHIHNFFFQKACVSSHDSLHF